MINAFIQTRKFVMAHYRLTEPEANTIVAQGVDFGMTQLANGNWGVHGIVPKSIFTDGIRRGPQEQVVKFADGSPNVGKARSLPVTSILVWCLVLGFLRFVKWRAKI